MKKDDAFAALAAVEDANAQLAEVMTHAPWRHGLFGLLEGMVVLGMGLAEPYCWIVYALALAVAAVIAWRERAVRGVFVTVLMHRSRTVILIALLAILGVAGWINNQIAAEQEPLALRVFVAILAGVLLASVSVAVNRNFVSDLRDRIIP